MFYSFFRFCWLVQGYSEHVHLGCLITSDWVVADGMAGGSFRRLPALLCLYGPVYLR